MTTLELIKILEKENPTAEVTVKSSLTDRYKSVKDVESRFIPAQGRFYVELEI